MGWVIPPPAHIKVGEPLNMTYELTLDNSFWSWASSHNVFDFVNT